VRMARFTTSPTWAAIRCFFYIKGLVTSLCHVVKARLPRMTWEDDVFISWDERRGVILASHHETS